jgi:hypothetical protein
MHVSSMSRHNLSFAHLVIIVLEVFANLRFGKSESYYYNFSKKFILKSFFTMLMTSRHEMHELL